MSKDLIDLHVSPTAIERAATALNTYISKSHAQQNEDELLGAREDFIWLVLSTKRMSPEKKVKPHRIPLAHPLIDPRTNSICLIVKDPQREYKDLLEAKSIKFISRVVGVTKLKGKFKPFEARRQLLQDHGLFLADDRVVPMLPQLLGKMFFDAKKQPIPVNLTKSNIKAELEKAISATYMHQNKGTCTSIKVASTFHSTAQVVKNITIALPDIVANIPDGWNNVQSIHIKTSQSISLPIWTCDLAAGERWTGVALTEGPLIEEVVPDKVDWASHAQGKRRRDVDEVESSEPSPSKRKVASRQGRETTENKLSTVSKSSKSISKINNKTSTKDKSSRKTAVIT